MGKMNNKPWSDRPEAADDQYRLWRKLILARDKHQCVMCKRNEKHFEVHHIKPWAGFVHLRYELDNGVTLCKRCHKSIKGKENIYEPIFVLHVGQAKMDKTDKTTKPAKLANDSYLNSMQARYGFLEEQQNEQEDKN